MSFLVFLFRAIRTERADSGQHRAGEGGKNNVFPSEQEAADRHQFDVAYAEAVRRQGNHAEHGNTDAGRAHQAGNPADLRNQKQGRDAESEDNEENEGNLSGISCVSMSIKATATRTAEKTQNRTVSMEMP